MNDELQVLLVGCGGMSNAWLGVIEAESDLQIAGLMDINRENAEKRAAEHGVDMPMVFDDLDKALDKVRPDIVFDCTVPEAHYEVTMKSLAAGCHVIGEKPLADSMEHAHKMVAKAEETGKLYAVMQNRRYLPTAPAMTSLVNSRIGKITTVNVDFYMGAHFDGFRTKMAHPLLLDMAIHTFDQARQFTQADPLNVFCKAFNPEGSWYEGKASAMCIFEMSNDIVFNYRGSWCSEGYNTPWAGQWRVVGTKGTAVWDEGKAKAEIIADPEDDKFFNKMTEIESDTPDWEVTGHHGCISECIDCLKQGKKPQTVSSDNIKSLAMVFSAIESDSTGQRVTVDV